MLGKALLAWFGIRSIPRMHIHEALHDDRVHDARNRATAPYGQALRDARRAGDKARQITASREARAISDELVTDRDRMREALGNVLDRVSRR